MPSILNRGLTVVVLLTFLYGAHVYCTAPKMKGEAKSDIKIKIPTVIEIYNPNIEDSLTIKDIHRAKFTIYTLVDVSCATCIQKLYYWNDFVTKHSLINKVTILPVCGSIDNFESFKYSFEKGKFKNMMLPLMLDEQHAFRKQNPYLSMSANSFLTDELDNVLLSGDPIFNKKDEYALLEILQ